MEWLLEGDPAIKWQVLRDLTAEPARAVAVERSRVAGEGWGRRLLELQAEDGQWGGGAYSPKWISTTYTLLLLRHLGIDPEDPAMASATARVAGNIVMGGAKAPFFEYQGEACVTAMALACAAYFGHLSSSPNQVDYLLAGQLTDGGWNCEAPHGSSRSSFHTTISVLEALLEYENAGDGSFPEVEAARVRAHEYLLERRLLRSLRSGEIVNPRWRLFSFPPRWHYDVLRALDYLQLAGADPDARCEEAIELVRSKESKDGRWPLQNRYAGKEHFTMEDAGKPSRWNTLRALRVLRWYEAPSG